MDSTRLSLTGLLMFLLVCAWPLPGHAQEERAGVGSLTSVGLEELLERVSETTGLEFLVDPRVPRELVISGIALDEISYATLLSILRNHGATAIEIEGRLNVVPEAIIRQYPTPVVSPDADGIPDDQWVTVVTAVQNMEAAAVVPILRPLLPQAAHLAALPPDRLIIVDRFANARRLVDILRTLEN